MSSAWSPRASTAYRQSWDSAPEPTRPLQGLLVTTGCLILPLGVLATMLRIFQPDDDLPALLASFIPYGTLAYALCCLTFVVACVRARRRRVLGVLTALATVGLGLHMSWLAPLLIPSDRAAATSPFTVMSLNLKAEGADVEEVVAQAQRADIVVLLEYTPGAVRRLDAAGIRSRFPYEVGTPPEGTTGSAIYSRFPLSDPEPLPRSSFQQWAATAAVPEVGSVRIIAAHPCNPFCGPGYWPTEHALLRDAASTHLSEPLIVAGDFNAVDDHRPMRLLKAMGLDSASDVAGSGWQPTYPANTLLPTLIPIDHVLISRQLTATSVSRFRVDGTDHMGLLATLAGS